MTFWKAFYLGPVALHLTKNIIRIPSSWICILAEFTGTHYIAHLLKHWSADPGQNCRLHFHWKYMQILIYLPINAYIGFCLNRDSKLVIQGRGVCVGGEICAYLLNYMYCLLLCIILFGLVADDSAVRFQENIFQQCCLDVILFLVLSCFTPIGFLSVCAHLCVAVAGAFHPV